MILVISERVRTHNGLCYNAAAVFETDSVTRGAVRGGQQLRRHVVGRGRARTAAAPLRQAPARPQVAKLHVPASVHSVHTIHSFLPTLNM